MNGIVRFALRFPYTFLVVGIVLVLLGLLAAWRTPVDIFPSVRIPVIGVAWRYNGRKPDEMAGRIIGPLERVLTTTVNDVQHIESQSYNGVGIVKIYFLPGVDIRTATAQVASVSQTHPLHAASRNLSAADP